MFLDSNSFSLMSASNISSRLKLVLERMTEPDMYGADFVGCILRNVFGWLWGMWGLVLGQDETCSNAKVDVSVKGLS